MGRLVWPPYQEYRDNTERWQDFERLLKRQRQMMTLVPALVALFVMAALLWVLAFGGPNWVLAFGGPN